MKKDKLGIEISQAVGRQVGKQTLKEIGRKIER